MTHANNFTIPVRFTFRPYQAAWKVCTAEVVGWTEDKPKGLLAARIAKPILQPIGERIKVRIAIPSPESDDDPTTLDFLYVLGSYKTYEVEMYPEALPPGIIAPHEAQHKSPEIVGREFVVLVTQREGYGGLFPIDKPSGPTKNARVMRDQFLHLENEVWELWAFLNRWGLWRSERGYIWGMSGQTHNFFILHPHRLWELQAAYRKAMTSPASTWLRSGTSLNLIRDTDPPYFCVEMSECDDAIKATITIDHISKVTFGICKRNDCRKLYERTTKQKRMYCSAYCAHIANVRKLRAAKKKSTSKGRKDAKG